MNAEEFEQLLIILDACNKAREWAKGKSLAEVWTQCPRGDWLLWLCGNMVGKDGWPTHQEVVLAACACARTILEFLPASEGRPRHAIETVERWARGEATSQEVHEAAWVARIAADVATIDEDEAHYYAGYAGYYAAQAASSSSLDIANGAYAAAGYAAYAGCPTGPITARALADIVRKQLRFAAIQNNTEDRVSN